MSERKLSYKKLENVDILDPFFDSLKSDYPGFEDWFMRKSSEDAYILEDVDDGSVQGMLYLKIEVGPIKDTEPAIGVGKWLKVGTLKINAAGTKSGERVIKKAFDRAISEKCKGLYVTVFPRHKELIALLEKFGFYLHGKKATKSGEELVLIKDFQIFTGNFIKDYPKFSIYGKKYWLLAIYPDYHTKLLPDSKLITDPIDVIADVSYANTIEKIYVGRVALSRMQPGDLVVMYRTTDRQGYARFRSVATSVCVVLEARKRKSFSGEADFIEYCIKHSVFDEHELRTLYRQSARICTVKLLYNAAFGRRPIRGRLLDEVGITEQPRWDLRELSEQQMRDILELGEVNEGIVVD